VATPTEIPPGTADVVLPIPLSEQNPPTPPPLPDVPPDVPPPDPGNLGI
jgi:hypothetical protein